MLDVSELTKRERFPLYRIAGYCESFTRAVNPTCIPAAQKARYEAEHGSEPSELLGYIVAPYGSSINGEDDPREQFLRIPWMNSQLSVLFLREQAMEGRLDLEWENVPTQD